MSDMDISRPLAAAPFHVLLALMGGACHGYGILQAVREQSGAGSRSARYPGTDLSRLIDAGLVAETDAGSGVILGADLLPSDAARPPVPGCRARSAGVPRARARRSARRLSEGARVRGGHRRDARAGRLDGGLLRVYPAAFRARFGRDMRATFAEDYQRARGRGSGAGVQRSGFAPRSRRSATG